MHVCTWKNTSTHTCRNVYTCKGTQKGKRIIWLKGVTLNQEKGKELGRTYVYGRRNKLVYEEQKEKGKRRERHKPATRRCWALV